MVEKRLGILEIQLKNKKMFATKYFLFYILLEFVIDSICLRALKLIKSKFHRIEISKFNLFFFFLSKKSSLKKRNKTKFKNVFQSKATKLES